MTAVSDNHFTFIETSEQLDAFATDWLPRLDGAALALDLEEDRERHYDPCVALVQLTIETHDFVLDPLSLPPRPLAAVLEMVCLTPSIVVVHGARNDVGGLKRDFGFGPLHLRDTQIAARFLARERFGLAALLVDAFGVTLDKQMRRSDWTRRPLSEEQLAYARADTSWLLDLWDVLEQEVEDSGWHDALLEECAALADAPSDQPVFDPCGWTSVKGAKSLDESGHARLAVLWRWREEVGEAFDLHPSRVIPPWAMKNLAERGVSLLRRPKVPGVHPEVLAEERDRLADLLSDPPPPPRRPRAKRRPAARLSGASVQDRVAALLEWRSATSRATGLDAGFLAPRSLLEALARCEPDPAEFAGVDDVRTWRLDRYADAWADAIRSLK